MRVLLLLLVTCNLCWAFSSGRKLADWKDGGKRNFADLDSFMMQKFQDSKLPSFSVFFNSGDETFAQGYGSARKVPEIVRMTRDTPIMVASVSKTVTFTALGMLWERGLFQLTDDVNDFLPWTLKNPYHPDTPITFQDFFTHTTSIKDSPAATKGSYKYGENNCPYPGQLGDNLKQIYSEGGTKYRKNNFLRKAPGTTFRYSNMATGIAGHLVEVISGESFPDFVQTNIFDSLGMVNSKWTLSDLPNPNAAAVEYIPKKKNEWGTWKPARRYCFLDYPSGSLRTSASDFAKFYRAIQNGGVYNDEAGLQQHLYSTRMAEAMRTEASNIKDGTMMGFDYDNGINGVVIGHNGGETGATSESFIHLDQGCSYGLFINADWEDARGPGADRQVNQIMKHLAQQCSN